MPLQRKSTVGLLVVVFGGITLVGLALLGEPQWLLVVATLMVVGTVLSVGAVLLQSQRALRAELSGVGSQVQQVADQQEATQRLVADRASKGSVRRLREQVERADARMDRRLARQAASGRRQDERLRKELHGHVARLELAQQAGHEQSVSALRADIQRLRQTLLLVDELTGSALPPLDALDAGETAALTHLAAVVRRCRSRVAVIDACGAVMAEVAVALVAAHGTEDVVLGEFPEGEWPGSPDPRSEPWPRIHSLASGQAPAPVTLLIVGDRSGPVRRRIEALVDALAKDLADDAVVVDVTATPDDAMGGVHGYEGFVIEPADATGTLQVIRRR